MAASDIVIKGAREHNLRNVDLVLPRNCLICFTGVSGSGKSSLAFDTLYAEGQRRYVESLSSFARQFLGQMPKPEVDMIAGLSPSISISQKSAGQSPRSTVGTITEIYDYLRVLYARVGKGHCPQCGRPITAQTRQQILQRIASLPQGTRLLVLAPLIRGQKGEYRDLFEDLLKQGFVRARVDGAVVRLTDDLRLDRQMRHDIEVVVDRLTAGPASRGRLAEAVELALKLGQGNLIVAPEEAGAEAEEPSPQPSPRERGGRDETGASGGPKETGRSRRQARSDRAGASGDVHLSAHYACTHCQVSFEPPSPQMFSFNSPQGMCPQCNGLGDIYTFDPERLIPDPSKSFQQGCVELVGRWRDLGRWRRHIYRGVAETLERTYGQERGTVLETAWEELDPKLRDKLLWGTGDQHITYTWRSGPSGHKWGGTWEGIIPKLLSQYRTTRSRMQRRALEKYMSVVGCNGCHGARLNPQARAVALTTARAQFDDRPERSLPEVCALAVSDAAEFFAELVLDATGQQVAEEALKEIRGRLEFLKNVGLDYLTLDRTAPTLAGGEMQRIRLAGQIGCGLVGVLYILDEPSIGLHHRDNDRLLETLVSLRDQGNTVVVVEHDEDTMRAADHVVDFGPGPGVRGGRVVATGPVDAVMAEAESVTGDYLAGRRRIEIPEKRRPTSDRRLVVRRAAHNNLQAIDVEIPLGVFVCVTGVSGSGKSSLVGDILVEALRRDLNAGIGNPGSHERIEGLEHLDKMIAIDQSPIGRTPRSNPATYVKVLDDVRNLYAQLSESKARGYQPGRFSFNVAGGRCEACEGNGSNKLEMDFLADVWVTCPVCDGHRFNRETLQVRFKGKSIAQVLEMDVQEALEHFENIPKIQHKLKTLHDVGLDYMKLGQPSPTLSGGEAQRVKLARELVKKSTGQTFYVLDEPTTGLHFADIELLLQVLHGFVDGGNTVVVVEHNLEVIKTADWIIDLGPEGGDAGGRIVAAGTPEQVAQAPGSYTGKALQSVLNGRAGTATNGSDGKRARAKRGASNSAQRARLAKSIKVRGASQHNLKGIDVDVPRDQFTVCCGPSGSGKTSLAMDTIYAEGQRRYVESLSAYARQFVHKMQKPKLEHIEGLSPAIAIDQKHTGHSPRSTVGTVTEIYDYLRILMARLGEPHCPDCGAPIGTQSADEVIAKVMAHPDDTRLYLMAPLEIQVGERYEALWDEIRASGYVRVRVDGETHSIDSPPTIDRRRRHEVEVVVDRVVVRRDARGRIADSVENALALGRGVLHVASPRDDVSEPDWPVEVHSRHFACDRCGRSFEPLSPHNFSFNSSLGWCPECEGLGVQLGANPTELLHDPKLSLAEGAVALWPDVDGRIFPLMLEAFARQTGLPIDVPFEQLGARHRRLVMHGTGDQWLDVHLPLPLGEGRGEGPSPQEDGAGEGTSSAASPRSQRPVFRFQYKGLYPALEEASRVSPTLRGKLQTMVDEVECSVCGGSRLRDDAAAVQLRGRTMDEICRQPLGALVGWFASRELGQQEREIAGEVIREIRDRLQFLVDVGLEYLTLARPAPTLSGGEMQRIRLAAQVGSGLCGVLYVLDEPTIGLHPRDNRRLLVALRKLRDLGNTLLVVEHDREVVQSADRLLDFGPGAGRDGGRIVAQGTPEQVATRRASVTGPYLSGKKAIPVPANRRMPSARGQGSGFRVQGSGRGGERGRGGEGRRDHEAAQSPRAAARGSKRRKHSTAPEPPAPAPLPPGGGWLEILGARHNNLKSIDVRIPLGTLTVVTGTSGSGKSSLVEDVLYSALARTLHRARTFPGAHDQIRGLEQVNKVIRVDQQPLGQTPTSNPATFTGVFDLIRSLFAQLPDSKLRGYTARRFSFNVPGGRCEKCEGNGQLKIEMHFLPDVWVECDACGGRRYEPETLAVRYHGQSIADVLDLPCSQAVTLFENISRIRRVLETLCDVGLDYLTLGQPAPTLSGGEAQRVKLAAELSRPDTGRTLYLLDEPTTGLHFEDLAKLLDVLNRLVDLGNTVVVIEHNLDVIKTADWVIDLGPEAGDEGGHLVVAGTPEDVVDHARRWREEQTPPGHPSSFLLPPSSFLRSYTGEVLAPVLSAGPFVERTTRDFAAEAQKREGEMDIAEVGRSARMPWEADGAGWHTKDRVGRSGSPCRWDGRILAEVVDRIEQSDGFSETDWASRGVVEIRAAKKSDGWFFHALTGEEWLLKMKFRTARNTFRREDLVARLDLKPLNEMPDLPLYGTEPRVRCKNLRGPWQEVELKVHGYEEIDRPEFWEFVDRAIEGFGKFTDRASARPDDLMPWRALGRKWHFLRKGFLKGGPPRWEPEVLEELCELLEQTAPGCEFGWGNKVLVPVHVKQAAKKTAWAAIQTKKPDAVHLALFGPKNRFPMGRLTDLGHHPELDTQRPEHDVILLKFRSAGDLARGDLAGFLKEHAASLGADLA
ncbi:MAG TPA: excinuclease ABC subunit UvrA [Thermoguttaceae bacterium]|nr:excinuclease ABC subunit UvrA [Thermoguttaceae bacterium]